MTDSFKARRSLKVGSRSYDIYSLQALEGRDLSRLPFSLKLMTCSVSMQSPSLLMTTC